MTLAAQRQDAVLAFVRRRGGARLAELVTLLGVSAVTVRRDVTALADRGLVVRVHGGITLPRRGSQDSGHRGSVFGGTVLRTAVGMVVPSVEYYWPHVIQGAQAAVAAADGRLVMRVTHYQPGEDRRQIADLLDRGVKTLLVAPVVSGDAGRELLRWLGGLAASIVLVERRPPPELPTLALDAATTAHAMGAGLAVRHLVTLGHRSVALVTSRSSPTSRALRTGWRDTTAELGLPCAESIDVEVPAYGTPGWPATYDDVLRGCRRDDVRAMLVHSDREAVGMLERARFLGIDVPGELAVVSYDDEVAAASDPPLTAVRPQKHRLGRLAAELALARAAEGAMRPVHRVELWPTLEVRESCGGRAP
ncbi:DNA-binding LacI/PurR family transcriptional regulator [Actinoalloteichus hoggarensis]|uniref:Arabinose metabolism transcriptional repressor n=1 Tax=Actinoalloteichus hoggarensis TaxID=1470176 RepID=A0A221W8V3_9PSEU|nr:substrate-binding domain-containing protein [Actinoalloteichus hoggarensis]ASO22026.1 Arabinose metabolism transcriptional repressor [Actinoalloteichus hoggarensis]MBB5923893.1 DNA-binding LacI/PurR family transcriptional regulator [Actinoalloteichus hoggarensis]